MTLSKKIIFSFIVALFSVVVVLIGGELIAQTSQMTKLRYWSAFVPDDDLAWRVRPNSTFEVEWYPGIKQTITSNSDGLRDTKNPEDIDHDKTVVMLQGDSNILGFGIQSEELLSKHLADSLANYDKGVEVINGGTSGYDLQHYVLQMEKLNERYQQDYNFIIFNMDNDYVSSLLSSSYLVSRPYYDLVDGELVHHDREFRVPSQMRGLEYVRSLEEYDEDIAPFFARKKRPVLGGIVGQSFLAHALYSRFQSRYAGSRWSGSKLEKYLIGEKPAKTYSDSEYNRSSLLLNYFFYLKEWPEPYIEGHKLISKLFEHYQRFDKTKTVVILMPAKGVIMEPEKTKEMVVKYSEGKGEVDLEKFSRLMQTTLDNIGMDYINLEPLFKNHANRDELFLKNNDHISPVAHKMIADEIASYLKTKQVN